MKIIGGSDFYDNVLAYGSDDSIKFIRHKDKSLTNAYVANGGLYPPVDYYVPFVKPYKNRFSYPIYHVNRGFQLNEKNYTLKPIKLIVCDTIHEGLYLHSDLEPSTDIYFWDLEHYEDWVIQNGFKIPTDHHWYYKESPYQTLKKLLSPREVSKKSLDWLISEKVSLLLFKPVDREDQSPWKVNSCQLRQIQFYKVMDAFSIYQELSMWVGGILSSSENSMVEITDNKIKLAKHGFDKLSFRKEKQN